MLDTIEFKKYEMKEKHCKPKIKSEVEIIRM